MNEETVSEYRQAIKFFLEHKYKSRIYNSTPIQAAEQIAEFLDHAKSHVKIFCKQLLKTVYDNDFLIDSLKKALCREVQVIVIMQRDKSQSQKFENILRLYGGSLYSAKNKAKKTKINFALMDRKALRYEKCNDQCEAVTEFHTSKAGQYSKLFDKIIQNAVEELPHAH